MSDGVAQALYGYSDGHRLIASSISLPTDAARKLRSITDMAFDGRAGSYLTVAPFPGLRRHAVIKTWPATHLRPGSVWSHVLLVDFVDLGHLPRLSPLASLFKKPQDGPRLDRSAYEKPLPLPSHTPRSSPARPAEADRLSLLWAAYGNGEAAILRLPDPESLEVFLLDMWAQQWPRLRRAYGFRTRYRVGSRPAGFQLQIVERLERGQEDTRFEVAAVPPWLTQLDRDLAKPDPQFRSFLHRFGAESSEALSDLAHLTEVHAALQTSEPRLLGRSVAAAFPAAGEMAQLKQALLGNANARDAFGPLIEQQRLLAIMHAKPAKALNLKELELKARLDELWTRAPDRGVELLLDTARDEAPNKSAVRFLIEAALAHARPPDIVGIASADASFAAGLVAQRPEFLASAAVWRGDDDFTDQLLGLLAEQAPEFRHEVLIALINSGAVDKAAQVLRQDPSAWWLLVSWGAGAVANGRSLPRTASVLSRLLDAVGPAGIGSAASKLDEDELLLMALVAPPQLGLWRQADASHWAEVASDLSAVDDPKLRQRALVVLALATGLGGGGLSRRRLWLQAFGPLHEMIEAGDLNQEGRSALSEALPRPGAAFDERLRAAVLKEIKNAKWPVEDIERIIAAAGDHRDEMLAGLQARAKKRKSWLGEVLDFLTP